MSKNENAELENQQNNVEIRNVAKESATKYDVKDGKCKLEDFHTKEFLKKIKETISKNKEIVFILPNGKEVKYE